MIDFLKQNISSFLTLFGLVFVHYIGLRMARLKDQADKKKMSMDAADGFRDDLMNRLDQANKRVDRKEELIEQLKEAKQILESDNSRLKWQAEVKNWEIENLNKQLKESNDRVENLNKKLQEKSYG